MRQTVLVCPHLSAVGTVAINMAEKWLQFLHPNSSGLFGVLALYFAFFFSILCPTDNDINTAVENSVQKRVE